jgi:hypothetical protein
MSFQEIQLTDETEGRGVEIEALVYAGRPAQQDSTHEPKYPLLKPTKPYQPGAFLTGIGEKQR